MNFEKRQTLRFPTRFKEKMMKLWSVEKKHLNGTQATWAFIQALL